VKLPKKGKKVEEKTVLILSCDGRYAVRKRTDSGLLAGLWEFPNVPGKLEAAQTLEQIEKMGLRPRNLIKQLERKHIFTHIRWEMRGFYVEVADTAGDFVWLTADEIRANTALPTAFRQFWEETEHV
jgi:A/G-specific adenine glycosylase